VRREGEIERRQNSPEREDATVRRGDGYLRKVFASETEWLIGWAISMESARVKVTANPPPHIGRLHPSPACTASNNKLGSIATTQLRNLGVWT